MNIKEVTVLQVEDFISCDWDSEISKVSVNSNSDIDKLLRSLADKFKEDVNKVNIIKLLSRLCSMMMDSTSINAPFKPLHIDYQADKRSTLPDDFTKEEFSFFEAILDETNDHWLKARLSDVLWLCLKPKKIQHAKVAINSYLKTSIDSATWNLGNDKCWERAARLSIQTKDFPNLEIIEDRLYSELMEEQEDKKFMCLWLAQLLDRLKIGHSKNNDIGDKLLSEAIKLKITADYMGARQYLALAEKKFKEENDNDKWIQCLLLSADCFVLEADSRSSGSNMVANSLYENAIQAYRRIPTKFREEHAIEDKLHNLRHKLTGAGQASLDEMGLFKTPGVDVTELVNEAKLHVSDKFPVEKCLGYFSGVTSISIYSTLEADAAKQLSEFSLSSFFGSTQMASDGRVIGKTPPLSLNPNKEEYGAVIAKKVHENFKFGLQISTQARILPALRQLLSEHRITRELLVNLCYQSPIVPEGRENLMAMALWLGFEHDFSNAIHLLCPQFEHIVRVQLKEAGAHTSNVDINGIENENGLSTLMDLQEAQEIFGVDLCFEIKALFTTSLGSNLRNEVAHGLLSDDSANNFDTIYAWWFVFRMIVLSLYR